MSTLIKNVKQAINTQRKDMLLLYNRYVHQLDEFSMDTPTSQPDNPTSFGNDFNIIRMVDEYGPLRVEAIEKQLAKMDAQRIQLEAEMHTLRELISVTNANKTPVKKVDSPPV